MRLVSKPIKVGSTEVGGKVSCATGCRVSCAKEDKTVTPIKKKRKETLDKICCIMKYSAVPKVKEAQRFGRQIKGKFQTVLLKRAKLVL